MTAAAQSLCCLFLFSSSPVLISAVSRACARMHNTTVGGAGANNMLSSCTEAHAESNERDLPLLFPPNVVGDIRHTFTIALLVQQISPNTCVLLCWPTLNKPSLWRIPPLVSIRGGRNRHLPSIGGNGGTTERRRLLLLPTPPLEWHNQKGGGGEERRKVPPFPSLFSPSPPAEEGGGREVNKVFFFPTTLPFFLVSFLGAPFSPKHL